MKPHDLNPDARTLEDAFFARENRRLLDEMRARDARHERREALRGALLVKDNEAFLDELLEMGIGAETVLAVTLIPLAAVAWADGTLQDREREAVLEAAEQRDVKPGTPARKLLESWLLHRPDPALITTWKHYVRATLGALADDKRDAARENIMGTARQVAAAAGGLLGLAKVSAAEQKMLDELDEAFRVTG